ncbi:MAG: hypothetical protein J7J15_01550 [Candidatus Aenigmarchaeota archaeon]|nr:hypothetical protein [Candidatus Aenigmarchaeota archaeon]
MKCEIFVNDYLPAIRAIIAKKLINFGFTQQEIADKLYLSQGAVALYKKQARGKKVKELEEKPEVKEKIEELSEKIISRDLKMEELEAEYCRICRFIFNK